MVEHTEISQPLVDDFQRHGGTSVQRAWTNRAAGSKDYGHAVSAILASQPLCAAVGAAALYGRMLNVIVKPAFASVTDYYS